MQDSIGWNITLPYANSFGADIIVKCAGEGCAA